MVLRILRTQRLPGSGCVPAQVGGHWVTRCHFAVRRFALAIVVALFTLSASDVSGLIIGAVRRRRREPDEDVPALGLRPDVPAGVATQVEEVDVNASFGTKFAFALRAQLM